MRFIYVLHFYQPDFQFREVLDEVYNKSYKRIFEAIKNSSNAKIVINITASTIEQFNKYQVGNLQSDLKELYKLGKVEFLSTSLSHTLLSHTTKHQARRQLSINKGKLSYYLGIPESEFNFLYPPELSVNDQVIDLAKEANLEGTFISHASIKDFNEDENKFIYKDLKLLVRSLKLSRILESPNINNVELLKTALNEFDFKDKTYVAIHDAEIIGYHVKDKVGLFDQLLNSEDFELVSLRSELSKDDFQESKSEIIPGTWEKMLINGKLIDPHWKNPENKIHHHQWKLSELVIKKIESIRDENKKFDLQNHLDYCQYSCQYWWASSYPFWSPGIISHSSWSWLYLAYRTYYLMENQQSPANRKFIKEAEKHYMGVIRSVAESDISKWHERNIRYYDEFIHPLKLNYQV